VRGDTGGRGGMPPCQGGYRGRNVDNFIAPPLLCGYPQVINNGVWTT